MIHQEFCIHNGVNHNTHAQGGDIWMNACLKAKQHGGHKKSIHGCTNLACTSLGSNIPCSYKCIEFSRGSNANT